MQKTLTPYEGQEPYFFISYDHKDSDRVFEILERLQTEGLNFWYFAGIVTDYYCIAEKISNCTGVIAFHSQNSKNSQNCKDEISLARHKNKKCISIYLEKVELSPGIEMAISSYEAIKFYEYPADKLENFYSDLTAKIKETLLNVSESVTASAIITAAVGAAAAAKSTAAGSIVPIAGAVIGGAAVASKITALGITGGVFGGRIGRLIGRFFLEDDDPPRRLENKEPSLKNSAKQKKESETPAPEINLNPYKGKKPYVFISYSHDDKAKVFEILSNLKKSGVRFWYDKGIKKSDEWYESLAEHIKNCEAIITFHSKKYSDSEYCKDEFFFAKKNKKKFIPIYLEDIQLSDGMDMAVSRFQAFKFYDYSAGEKENFYSELLELLQSCF